MALNSPMYKLYNTPFKWGEQDCMLAAANYYLETTGVDYAIDFRGKYNTAISAYRLLIKAGGMEAILLERGFQPVPVTNGKTGDVALQYLTRQGYQMGIINRDKVVFAGGREVPLTTVDKVYTNRK